MNLAFLRTRKSTGGTWLRNREGWRDADGKWVVRNGVGAQGEGHDGMRGEVRGKGAWLRNREGWRDVDGKWVDGRKME